MEQEGITNSATSSHYLSQITNLISFHASYANSDGLVSSHVPGQVFCVGNGIFAWISEFKGFLKFLFYKQFSVLRLSFYEIVF